ncbi:hypothetical protein SNE40_005869 [Patella caerulea]|uniref:Uncharacterized protein n=1 Tax=Patella caerulea TaxID=87958 RepID=A0AAN8K8W9_PATCE
MSDKNRRRIKHGKLIKQNVSLPVEITSNPDSNQIINSIIEYENTYQLTPPDTKRFNPSIIQKIMDDLLTENLVDQTYNSMECGAKAIELAGLIKSRVRHMDWNRYRIVVQVTIGQHSDQGMAVASRCVWDENLDNYACVNYQNKSIFAIAVCFGLYLD